MRSIYGSGVNDLQFEEDAPETQIKFLRSSYGKRDQGQACL